MKATRRELQLDKLRVALLPLMVLENLLVVELAEGTTSFSTVRKKKPNIFKPFVRAGWQDRIASRWDVTDSFGKGSSPKFSTKKKDSGFHLAILCCKTLAASVPHIQLLWNHWITKFYVSKRVIPLADSAP